jgi:hypothetical protein
MGVVIDPKQYVIGAADVYYRPAGTTGEWKSIGATIDDVVFRVNQSRFNPSEEFNGLLEAVRDMDYLSRQSAECEFSMPEFAGEKLKLAVLGAVVTTSSPQDTSGGWSTTLAATASAGATSISVASATGIAVGHIAHIGIGSDSEYRVIDKITGTTLSFRDPLLRTHASGAAVVRADSDGKTEITPGNSRRMPATAYNDFVLVAQSPSDYYELYLYNAISTTEQAEISFGNESVAAIKVTLATRRDGLNLAQPSWRLRVPA